MNPMLTLKRFISNGKAVSSCEQKGLKPVLDTLSECCAQIANLVGLAAIDGMVGQTNQQNSRGDFQIPLDLAADGLLVQRLLDTEGVAGVVSEERDSVCLPDTISPTAEYIVFIDGLDGSAQLDDAGVVGTVWGIYRLAEKGRAPTRSDLLQPGRNMVAAGMALYGSQTLKLFTTGDGLHLFALDRKQNQWVLVDERLTMGGSRSGIYSINEGNTKRWKQSTLRFVRRIKSSLFPKYSLRYAGSLVADAFRVMRGGGFFGYPGDYSNPNGKLEYSIEGAPIAFMVEQAGGQAITCSGTRLLDVCPTEMREKTSLLIGEPSLLEVYAREIAWDTW